MVYPGCVTGVYPEVYIEWCIPGGYSEVCIGGIYQVVYTRVYMPYIPWVVYTSLYASLPIPPWVYHHPGTLPVTVLHSWEAMRGVQQRSPGHKRGETRG